MYRPIGRNRRPKHTESHNTSSDVCLFAVASGALFLHKKLRLRLGLQPLVLRTGPDLAGEKREAQRNCGSLSLDGRL